LKSDRIFLLDPIISFWHIFFCVDVPFAIHLWNGDLQALEHPCRSLVPTLLKVVVINSLKLLEEHYLINELASRKKLESELNWSQKKVYGHSSTTIMLKVIKL